MYTIIIHSADLKPDVSKASIVIAVGKGEDIRKRIMQLASEIQDRIGGIAPGCFNDLKIICTCNSDGLQLGSVVNAQNISDVFAPLKYKVGNITLLGCDGASNYYRGNKGTRMCSKLALATFANVRASYNSGVCSEETDIVTWNQRGKIVMLERYENDQQVATYHHPGTLLIHELKKSYKKLNPPKSQFCPDNFFLYKLFLSMRRQCCRLIPARFIKYSFIPLKTGDS